MRQIIFFFFCFLLIGGCRQTEQAKPGQGVITFNVSYPEPNKFGIKSYLFPKQITLVFKDDKASFIASGGLGMIQLVNLLDYNQRKFTALLIDNMRGNLGCTLTPEEIKLNENSASYQFEETSETKTIAGLVCKKAIVNDLIAKESFEVYYFDKIKFHYWNSPFKDFNYLLMEYTHTINGLTMKLEASRVDLSTPVDTLLFDVKGTYSWVNQETFFTHLSRL